MRITLTLDLATEAFHADPIGEMAALMDRVAELALERAEWLDVQTPEIVDLFDSDADKVGTAELA